MYSSLNNFENHILRLVLSRLPTFSFSFSSSLLYNHDKRGKLNVIYMLFLSLLPGQRRYIGDIHT